MPECQAVNRVQHRCKIPEVQKCQQRAAHIHSGVYLCGTHWNALHNREAAPLQAVVTLERPEF